MISNWVTTTGNNDTSSSKFPVPIGEWNSKGLNLDLSNPKLSDEQRKRLQRNIDIMRDSIVRNGCQADKLYSS